MERALLRRVFAGLVLTLSLGGCGAGLDDDDANAAADGVDGAGQTSALLSVTADPASAAMTPQTAATAAASAATTFFQPPGCVTSSATGATVSYTFNGCTGPYGLVNVNGTLTATYSNRTLTGWTVAVTGEVRANRATLRPDATAVISYSGGARSAQVTVRGGGTGPRGTVYTNAGTYTSTWDGSCFGLNGAITTSANGQSLTTTVNNFRRCRGECPQAGGSLSVSGPDGSLSITYSGGATATFTGSRGRSATITLFCTAG